VSHLNVVNFPVPDYRDPVKALRNLANQIEAGDFGEVTSCGVVIFGDAMEVFGSGEDSPASTIALLFNAAALRFARSIEEHGR
jgi:hypothetical protein